MLQSKLHEVVDCEFVVFRVFVFPLWTTFIHLLPTVWEDVRLRIDDRVSVLGIPWECSGAYNGQILLFIKLSF